jgi:CHAT domain-containing protein
MRLVVLAACSSDYSGNGLWGPESLVRALLAGKVPNVIASRWDVDSQSTGELFKSFYTYLSQGETPAQALQHARHTFRKAHPERTHPYYWAGFYLTGKAS